MILTSSDVSALSTALSWWERGEYFFSFVVAGACFGEYVADFKPKWYRTGDEERDARRKESISKISTLVLVAALVFELVCVVRSNALAGEVIGSINSLATNAASEAKRAHDLAEGASDIAKHAKATADAAKSKADAASLTAEGARKNSANALVLARGARREADLFKQDLATEQAELDRIRTPRSLIKTADLVAALHPFAGTTYTLFSFQDSEAIHLTEALGDVLHEAGWIREQPSKQIFGLTYINLFTPPELVPPCLTTGIQVRVWSTLPIEALRNIPESALPESFRAAKALLAAMPSDIVPVDPRNVDRPTLLLVDNDVEFNQERGYAPVIVCVGKKP